MPSWNFLTTYDTLFEVLMSVTAARHGLTLFVLGCSVTVTICMYNLGLGAILWEMISSDAWWIVCL